MLPEVEGTVRQPKRPSHSSVVACEESAMERFDKRFNGLRNEICRKAQGDVGKEIERVYSPLRLEAPFSHSQRTCEQRVFRHLCPMSCKAGGRQLLSNVKTSRGGRTTCLMRSPGSSSVDPLSFSQNLSSPCQSSST